MPADAMKKTMAELEALMEETSPELFWEALCAAISRKVEKTKRCWLTGKPLAHEALCRYCGDCPAGRWFTAKRRLFSRN